MKNKNKEIINLNTVCSECGINNGHYSHCKVLQYGETEINKLIRIEEKIDGLARQLAQLQKK